MLNVRTTFQVSLRIAFLLCILMLHACIESTQSDGGDVDASVSMSADMAREHDLTSADQKF